MLSTRIAVISAFIMLSLAGVSSAYADDGYRYSDHKHDHGHQNSSFYGGDGLPSYIGGIGTYAGGIAGIRDRRNGIYFAMDRLSNEDRVFINRTIRPRIIDVNRKTAGAECSYEAGVCVIRP